MRVLLVNIDDKADLSSYRDKTFTNIQISGSYIHNRENLWQSVLVSEKIVIGNSNVHTLIEQYASKKTF